MKIAINDRATGNVDFFEDKPLSEIIEKYQKTHIIYTHNIKTNCWSYVNTGALG